MKQVLKIGNAGGYWGDDPGALERQVRSGRLDYITMDFLAEITMSIMQKQKSRDPSMGYARDLIEMLRPVMAEMMAAGTKLITNAGGINPESCAEAIWELGQQLGVKPKIALVYGDDILEQIGRLNEQGAQFANMETGESFSNVADRLLAANIYFGATAVVEALKEDPDIIITGRVTDTGITLAAMIHEFGWKDTDWDKLAAGIVAGHIIECGAQSTGGNFTDWHSVGCFDNIGYPIIEMRPDGSFIVTKHEGTGGLVSTDTVREQLFYEMGSPRDYITPDVVADFSTIELRQEGPDRVSVTGVKGFEPTPFYKVSMAYEDGFKSVGEIAICGPKAREKAEAFAGIFWRRLKGDFTAKETEYFGWNACHRSLVGCEDGNEIILRLGVRTDQKDDLRRFGKLVPSLILSGPPGVAVLGGVPRPIQVVSYWPALLDKTLVHPEIRTMINGVWQQPKIVARAPMGNHKPAEDKAQLAVKPSQGIKETLAEHSAWSSRLDQIALGRSGDKGNTCNIGIMARDERAYHFLEEFLTAQRVKDLFQELCRGRVVRYSLPNMLGFNFLLEEALGGGGTKTLRTDAQGKTFAQALINQTAPIPHSLLSTSQEGKA